MAAIQYPVTLATPLRGRTATTSQIGRLTPNREGLFFFSTTGGEIRIVFHGEEEGVETRENPNVTCLTIVLGQFGNTTASIGIGNPSCPPYGRLLASSLSRDLIVKTSPLQFWLAFDIFGPSPLIALGVFQSHARHPSTTSTRLIYRLTGEEASLLHQCRHVSVTNWTEPISYSLLAASSLSQWGTLSFLNLAQLKFHDNGAPRLFPGCTWVVAIDRKTWLFKALKEAQRILREEFPSLGRHYAFLPPESFHMTTFDALSAGRGINLEGRLTDWEVAIERILQRVKQSQMDLKMPPVRVRFSAFDGHLKLALLDGPDLVALRQWRRRISEASGLDTDDDYRFHITLAYLQWPLGDVVELKKEKEAARQRMTSVLSSVGEVTLGPARLCRFNDMFAFHPID